MSISSLVFKSLNYLVVASISPNGNTMLTSETEQNAVWSKFQYPMTSGHKMTAYGSDPVLEIQL